MNIKSILQLIPIYIYYLIESMVHALPITLIWKYNLSKIFNVELSYINWVWIIWVIKILMFDVLKINFNKDEKI